MSISHWQILSFIILFLSTEQISAQTKTGNISVITDPPGTYVEVDGKLYGKSPVDINKLDYGEHKLKMYSKSYGSMIKNFNLSEKNKYQCFYYKLALVSISGQPQNAVVKIDNQTIGLLPISKSLIACGTHKLTLEKNGYNLYKEYLHILLPQHHYEKDIYLTSENKQLKSMLLSIFIPGLGQMYSGRKIGIILGSVTVCSFLVSQFYYNNYMNKKDEYESNKVYYQNNKSDNTILQSALIKMNDGYNAMEKSYEWFRTSLILSSILWLYNIFDSYFFCPQYDKLHLEINTKAQISKISLNYPIQ